MGCAASQLAAKPSTVETPAAAPETAAATNGKATSPPAAAAAGSKAYIVEGTPEAHAVDQDFALVVNASLAKNEYPKAEL